MAHYCHPTSSTGGGVGLGFRQSASWNKSPDVLVGILGHSYVSHLPIERHTTYPPGFVLRPFAAPGATLDNIRDQRAWSDLIDRRPAITVLLLGGNDIVDGVNTQQLALKIKTLAEEIESETNGRCLVMGLECRLAPWNIAPENYNMVKNAVNHILKRKYKFLNGRLNPIGFGKEYLDIDGVHLTLTGSEVLLEQILAMVRKELSNIE